MTQKGKHTQWITLHVYNPKSHGATHWDGYPSVVICEGSCQEYIPYCSSLCFEAACCAYADDKIRVKLMHSQIGCHCCWHSAHIVYAVHLALACRTIHSCGTEIMA